MTTPYAVLASRRSAASWIIGLTSISLFLGIGLWLLWRVTGRFDPLATFFQLINPVALVSLAACQLWLAIRAWRQFAASQTMWVVWAGLTLAAFSQVTGAVVAQVLSVQTPLNPWPKLAGDLALRGLGLTLSGPVHLSLLLLSFALAIAAHRSLGWDGRLLRRDWVIILVVAGFTARQAWDLFALYPEHMKSPAKVIPWLTDPLLLVLLVLALILWRTVGSMEGGLNGLCWGSYGLGIVLTELGDFSMWTISSSHLSMANASLVAWLVWLPAYGAFALGPACHMEAVALARRGSVR